MRGIEIGSEARNRMAWQVLQVLKRILYFAGKVVKQYGKVGIPFFSPLHLPLVFSTQKLS